MATDHLPKLGDRLGGVDLQGQASFLGEGMGVAQQVLGAGVDLRRRDHAGQASRGMLKGQVEGLTGLFEAGWPAIRIAPIILQGMAVAGEPGGVAKGRRDTGADAAVGQQIEPTVEGGGEIDHRGTAASQQFGERHLDAGRGAGGVVVEDGQKFIERGMVKIGAANFIGDALAQRLAGRVAVDIDQPRHDQAVAAVDLNLGRAGVAPADMVDQAVGKGHIAVIEINMALVGGIPADQPGGVADHGGGHRQYSARA